VTPEWFTDRDLGGIVLPGLLRDAGLIVHRHDDHFGPNAQDEVWIPDVARRGWIILTQNYEIQRLASQRDAVMRSGARLIFVPGAQKRGEVAANHIIDSIDALSRFVGHHRGPYIARLHTPRRAGVSGEVKMKLEVDDWVEGAT
jgi:hypothetical protein